MNLRIGTALAGTLVWVAGCAGQYAPSNAALETRAQLTPAAARAILTRATQQTAEHKGGITSVVVNWDLPSFPTDVQVSERGLAFVAQGKQLGKGESLTPGCELAPTADSPRAKRCHYLLEPSKLIKVRVAKEDGGMATVPGYDVILQQSAMFFVTLNVPSAELDSLVAAVTFFSPQAKLVSGAGF